MSKSNTPTPIRPSDYEAIEEALLDSARGRWFLNEYAKRNRTADTQMLLEAINKLEAAVLHPGKTGGNDHIRRDLIEMSEAIAQTRREIAAITSPDDSRLVTATEELDAIVEATEKATSDILGAAEDVQETAWILREKGAEEAACDRLDERATDIYTACSFQDVTGQRTGKVVEILRYLENRVNSMIDIWGLEDLQIRQDPEIDARPDNHLLNGPQLEGKGLEQIDVDKMIEVQDGGFGGGYADAATASSQTPAIEEDDVAWEGARMSAHEEPQQFQTYDPGDEIVFTSARPKRAADIAQTAGGTSESIPNAAAPAIQDSASTGDALPDSTVAEEPAASKPATAKMDEPLNPRSPEELMKAAERAGAAAPRPDGAVDAAAFGKPDDLTLPELDEPKKTALFS